MSGLTARSRARLGQSNKPIDRTATHYVYRAFDANGLLLYVGCTNDVARRLAAHRSQAAWAPYYDCLTSESYPDRDSALAAESAAIRDERPFFNALPEHTAMVQANRNEATRLLHQILPSVEHDSDWYTARDALRPLIADKYPVVDDAVRLEVYLAAATEAGAA